MTLNIDLNEYRRKDHASLEESKVILALLPPGSKGIVLDVGAHYGDTSKLFATNGYTCHAFEPDPDNRDKLLNETITLPVHIDNRAVSNTRSSNLPFYRSPESTGISSLTAFRETHSVFCRVDTTTLESYCLEKNIDHIDFLKIDTEGYDLMVLQGVPWGRIKPSAILCEFEDFKTVPLGYDFHRMAGFLVNQGYAVFVSEWHPIIRYGISHDWHKFAKYPCELSSPKAWGNLLAFINEPPYDVISQIVNALVSTRPEPETANCESGITINTVARQPYFTENSALQSNYRSSNFQADSLLHRDLTDDDILANSKCRLAAYQDRHKGQRCVIVGNGPSLNKMDLSFLENEITFGMNRIYLLFDKWKFRPSYYVSVNPLVIEQSAAEILKINAPKFLSSKGISYFDDPGDIHFLRSIPQWFFSKDPRNGICEGWTVTYVAMQLAYFMGFSEIVLIGVDHHFATKGEANKEVISEGDDPNHFHPGYFGKGIRWHLPDLERSEGSYHMAREVFESEGRRILDATVDGKLTIFPKVDYRELFYKNQALSAVNAKKSPTVVETGYRYQVSAIVSTYNSERFIRNCLQGLVNQTLHRKGRLEIIVVNSGSIQNELSIVEEFRRTSPHIRYIRTEERETVYQAWNRGIRAACGTYVTNANTDDRFAPDALEAMAKELDRNPAIHAVYGDWVVTRTENDTFDSLTPKFLFHYPDFYPPLFLYYQITSHAAMIRRKVFDEIGYYDGSMKVFGDRELMLRFSAEGLKASHLPHVVGLYLENPGSVERTEQKGSEEFVSLRKKYLSLDLLAKLFGYRDIPDNKTLASLYAAAGCLGKDFYWWNGTPVSDLDFATSLFLRALELDPGEPVALNNLGILLAVGGKQAVAIELFNKGLKLASPIFLDRVSKNLAAAKQKDEQLVNYAWLESKWMRMPADAEMPFAGEHPITVSNSVTPLISVIIPTYNRPAMLKRAIESVLAQTHRDFEIVVVNDCGTDVKSLITSLQARAPITYVRHEKNMDRAAARNTGLKLAKGKYIVYLDDDDIFYPDHLLRRCSLISEKTRQPWLIPTPIGDGRSWRETHT